MINKWQRGHGELSGRWAKSSNDRREAMKKLVVLLVANIWLTACVSPGMVQDCRARRDRATQVAAIAAADLKPGWTAQEVRAALGEPDEIVAAKGLSKFDIWKYYLSEDCKTHLGMTAPQTESSSFKAIWSVLIPTPNEAAGFRAQGKPTRGREPTAGRGAGAGPNSIPSSSLALRIMARSASPSLTAWLSR
jgi:hypothetical protein